jgi:hypothetical protein
MSAEEHPPDDAAKDGQAEEDGQDRAAYLPIGIAFLVLGLGGLLNDSFRYSALAFVPVGIVFLTLGLQGRRVDGAESDADPSGPGEPPDVTPR